ncbi:ATP synthase F0 subunit B [Patescibacteria group bacterium]|nr:ATP synthase F0 subunit B [Patescibacteria group bacterium]
MQQLFSAFGIDWRLLIAQAVNFGIVLIALRYFLYTPILTMLAKRQEMAAKGVADAERAARALAGADDEAARRVAAADAQAEEIVSLAREAGNAEKQRLLKETEERASAAARDAKMRAQEAAARLARESERDIVRLAVLAAEKILKKQYD